MPHANDPQDHDLQDHGLQDHGLQDHGLQDHGPQDHGPQDHGPQDHGPQDHGLQDHGHTPVLPAQTRAALAFAPGQTVLDCTLGRGGHAHQIIPLIPGGRYVGLDVDPTNLAYAQDRLAHSARDHQVTLTAVHTNFRQAAQVLEPLGLAGRIDRLLADIGFASNQVDDPQRGLLFKDDGPLDMRLDQTAPTPTAKDLVNQLPEQALADLIYQFGEERLSRRIAKRIVEHRTTAGPIETTGTLSEIVRKAYGSPRNGPRNTPRNAPRNRQRTNLRAALRINPATRTFQALRIAVNDELGALDDLLAALPRLLAPLGRAGIISFHSLEDRRVKHCFLSLQQQGLGQRITRKPFIADEAETLQNPRSRSAKLRVWEKSADALPASAD